MSGLLFKQIYYVKCVLFQMVHTNQDFEVYTIRKKTLFALIAIQSRLFSRVSLGFFLFLNDLWRVSLP